MYNILYDNPNEDIFLRLLKIRNIDDKLEDFLNPTFVNYRQDPFLINDMKKGTDRIIKAIKNNEKIMIFGDYDVDGITSSFVIYKYVTKFLKYKNISIRLPHRVKDGYGIKSYHIDEIKKLGVSLIITVDNGITAIKETIHANNMGIDMIITDHHKALNEIPNALAIINPQISKKFHSKEIAGVGVAFKLITALSSSLIKDAQTKQKILNYFLPIVAIGTVGDCVPLINENRLMVKLGLQLLNNKNGIPNSVKNLLNYLKIKNVDTFHIGFMIAPRLNAAGRLLDPGEGLKCLLYSNIEKQLPLLQNLDELNNKRKKTEEIMLKEANEQIDINKKIIIAKSEKFHEGVVGLIAGRLAEKYYKPTIVLTIRKDENEAVGSLRGPDYFDIVEMMNKGAHLMERYGGHKQAGGLTVKLDKLDELLSIFEEHANNCIGDNLEKTINVDTKIYGHEFNNNILNKIDKLAPFGEGNLEPIFLIDQIVINNIEKVGKNGNGHMKLLAEKDGNKFSILFRGKGGEINNIEKNETKKIIGKIKKDDFNGGFYIDGTKLID